MNNYREVFREYAERMKEIRLLSTPDLSDISDSSEYSRILIDNFSKIGGFAIENRKVINEYIKPLISSNERLSDEDKERLSIFVELLVEDDTCDEIDVHLSELMNDLLVTDEIRIEDSTDSSAKVVSMGKKVRRDYPMVSALTRYINQHAETFRKAAVENRDQLEVYLDKEQFIKLSDEAKGAALQFSLMGALHYAYHSALCHDLGKLFIIDVISMYGRSLLDDEFSIIKDHPDIGADLAAEHASTRDYADVIRGHHIWYDCSRGYPNKFDTFKSPYKTVIDIVLAADCLDAATDSVGRSYNKGKTFSDYEKEVAEGSGTHYAPFLPELFKAPELRADIEYLLNEGRNKMYQETFRLITVNGAN
ncbi:MAG: hypothetical protein J5824_04195 [Lachnospiraceae bacterium]|nr:hypothetical protein [Lachnospiraceae bacterium]